MQKRRDEPDLKNEKSLALKVEKFLKKITNPSNDDSDHEDESDRELTIITRTVKKF